MPTIRISQPHTLGQSGARAAMGQFEEVLAKYRARLDWQGNNAQVKGTGVSGDVVVAEREVTVRVELGMVAKLAGIDPVKLESSIKKRLQSALGGPA